MQPTASASAPVSTADDDGDVCAKFVDAMCDAMGRQSKVCEDTKHAIDPIPRTACSVALRDLPQALAKVRAQRKDCDVLIDRVCADLGRDTDTCQMVTTNTAKFGPERCSSLLERYAETIHELRRIEQGNQPLASDLRARIESADAVSIGPQTAAVTLVFFSDFQCPFSARAAATLSQLKTKYADRIRIVFRQYPLSFHEHAKAAATAALAAHEQGKFLEYHQVLFQNQSNLTESALVSYAKQLKLDLRRFDVARSSTTLEERVDADIRMAQELNVTGTPALYINGKRAANAASLESVSAAIEKQLQ